MSRLDHTVDPKPPAVRRVEVITGDVARRRWSDDEKAQAIEASLAPGAVVSQVARRHGLTPQQLFTWRRDARLRAAETDTPFAPVVVETTDAETAPAAQTESKMTAARPPIIELDIGGSSVWIWRGADPAMVTAIVGALKAEK